MVGTGLTDTVEGLGLHSAEPCWVRLIKRPGPVALRQLGAEWPIAALRVVRCDNGVRVASPDGALEVDLVEHLLAAFAGLGIRDGVAIDVHGPELPFLDAASGTWSAMLGALSLGSNPPPLLVRVEGTLEVEDSRYDFAPHDGIDVSVTVDYTARGLGPERAAWRGDVAAFLREIAPARSFGFMADHESLRRAGRAAGAIGSALLVFDASGRQVDSGPRTWAFELARHKLLDLLGDWYLCGGPPLGRLSATRPGHSRNIQAARRALELGIVTPIDA